MYVCIYIYIYIYVYNKTRLHVGLQRAAVRRLRGAPGGALPPRIVITIIVYIYIYV